MYNPYIFKKAKQFIFIFLYTFLMIQCNAVNEAADRLLFGITEAFGGTAEDVSASTVASCSSEITVSYTTISLVEDGNISATFDISKDKGIAETTATPAWGYNSFQTCVYLPTAFTGTVEIPVTLTNPYDTRLTVSHREYISGVAQAVSVTFPDTLVFTSNDSPNRHCFTLASPQDAVRSTPVSSATINLGKVIMKNASNEVVTGSYTGLDPCDITATVDDDEGPGIRVSNISTVMEEPGVSTPNSAQFRVVLRTLPTADVTIGINDTYDSVNSANREGTTSPTSLTFTTGNWSTDQLVTVTSVDDLEVDGLKVYTIQTTNTVSSDSDYNGLNPRDVVVYNRDQSVPGYAYERFDATTGTTTSSGENITGFAIDDSNIMGTTYSTFKLKLRSKPSSNVDLTLTKNCGSRCNLLTSSLTFTPSNWNVFQTIQVEGNTDSTNTANADYDIGFTISSSDVTYKTGGVTPPVFKIRACDNDGTHIIQPCNFSGSPLGTTGNRFTGAEPSASSVVWLIGQSSPASDVTVPLSSTDTTEGTVPGNITITSSNYNRMGTADTNKIVMTHADDTIVDGPQNWTVTTGVSSAPFSYDPLDIYATTTDNENYFYVNVTGNTQEGTSTAATIDVCLGADNPNASVTLNLACTVASDECGTLSTASITFPIGSQVSLANASNSGCSADGKKQSFTVQGFDDSWADGTQTFTVTMTKSTTETTYASAPNTTVTPSINNQDNEPAGKAIFITSSTFNGEMTAQGVLGADNICNTNKIGGAPSGTYKALIASSSGGEVNDRSVGSATWPIAASTYYYLCKGSGYTNCSDEHQRIFISDGGKSFNPMTMSQDFTSTISDEFWTGLTVGMSVATQASTPAGTCVDGTTVYRHNCHGFTYQNCPTNGAVFFYGQIWKNASGGTVTSNESICSASKKIICVQQ